MNDSLTKRDSISTSAKHRDDVSPLPWRVENVTQTYHVNAADGGFVTLFVSEADAALIVEAVNNYEVLIQERRRLIGELDSVKAQLDWHKRQLKAVKSDAESEERWANQYFEQAQKAEAERDRLRDLVARLAEYIRREGSREVCVVSTRPGENYHVRAADLLREAREALGEGEP